MNSTGRPRMPLPLVSLAKSSHARLAWIPYCALLPESAAGNPILIGFCAYARRRNTGAPTARAAPLTVAVARNSRRRIAGPSIRRTIAALPVTKAPHYSRPIGQRSHYPAPELAEHRELRFTVAQSVRSGDDASRSNDARREPKHVEASPRYGTADRDAHRRPDRLREQDRKSVV